MKKTTKKIIAPIIITILVICYFIFVMWAGLFTTGEIPLIIKLLFLIIPIGLIILSLSMLLERINEIKEGEEDDIGKY